LGLLMSKQSIMAPPPRVRAFFDGHEDYLRWDREVQGNKVEDGCMLLGMRAAGEYSVGSLLHEMAHLIEIDDDRCHLFGWGLRTRKVTFRGRTYSEPLTFQCSERELRTMAIQKVLSKHLRVRMDLNYWGPLITWLPDWYAHNFGESVSCNSPKWKRLVVADLRKRIEAVELDEVLVEWDRKANLLREVLA
jgi:hypothetical protein